MNSSSSNDIQKLAQEINATKQLYLVGWNAIAKYVGVHQRTVKRWHYKICNLPYNKSYPSKQGRVMIPKYIVQIWADSIGKIAIS